jgi:hypothetical protein
VLFGLFLAVSLPTAAVRTAKRTVLAVSTLGESPEAARRRVLGPPWVDAVEGIREAVPENGAYLLVNGGLEWEGGPYWVRFDLAPRRAIYLGQLAELPDGETVRRSLPKNAPDLVVIALREPYPPILMKREDFLQELSRRHGRG